MSSIGNLFKYNFKIMLSNKYIVCAVYCILFPFFLNFTIPEYVMFEIYFSIIGIVALTDIFRIESYHGISEMIFINNFRRVATVCIRLIWSMMFIVLLSILSYGTMYLKQQLFPMNQAWLPSYWPALGLSLSTSLFLGCISMTIANLTSNVILGYIAGFFYWMICLVNQGYPSILHLFQYSNFVGLSYEDHFLEIGLSKLLFIVITIILALSNLLLLRKSPINTRRLIPFGKKH